MSIAERDGKKPKILAVRAAKFPFIVRIKADFYPAWLDTSVSKLCAISTGEKTRRNTEATCNSTPCVVDMVIDD